MKYFLRLGGFGSTAVWRNGGFSASYDSFVVAQTFVLRKNICGKNRQLLVAANRYGQANLQIELNKLQ